MAASQWTIRKRSVPGKGRRAGSGLYRHGGVLAHREWDTQNIWKAGDAAFMRSWNGLPGPYRSGPTATPSVDAKNYDFAPLPAGKGGNVSTFGGHGYAVSKYSAQVEAAVKLVRFLCRRDTELKRLRTYSGVPTIPDLQ